jgi:hypothetical protein
MHWLPVTGNVPSSPIVVTLMMEALGSSETSVLTRSTWRNFPEDGILHTHHCENLKSYKATVMPQDVWFDGMFTMMSVAKDCGCLIQISSRNRT